jgi:S1-C subfamily serine protease
VLSNLQPQVEQIQRDIQSTKASLEGETGLIGRIAATYSPSVCLIEGTYQFIERGTGKVLREAQTPDTGIAIFEGESKFQVTVEGTGPRVEETVIGTGFLIGRGLILTNLHVVRPWWKDEAAEQILGHGFLPRMLALNAYFPSVSGAFRLEIIGASENYDLAVCRFNQGSLSVPTPSLAGNEVQPQVGQSVVLLAYPAGVEALLARLDESVARDIVSSTSLRVPEVARELANRGLIRPLPTQGHITALLPTRIIHDAATTTGGSGGPLFNKEGVVIGINYAIFTEFSASNFAVPAGVIRDFLRQQGIAL